MTKKDHPFGWSFFGSSLAHLRQRTADQQLVALPTERSEGGRERPDRCRWQMKGGERVTAVGVQRSRTVGKAHTGHRNSKTDPRAKRHLIKTSRESKLTAFLICPLRKLKYLQLYNAKYYIDR